jgi:hypothetical protein
MEELSLSQALTLDHPLVLFAENVDLNIFEYSRVLVLLGKGIEQQRHLGEVAAHLYRRVLRRVLNMSRQAGMAFNTRIVLGDILVALGHLDDGARALSWACRYGNPSDEKGPLDSDESSTSEDEEWQVAVQTTAKWEAKRIHAGQTPESVRAWLDELVLKYEL